MKSTKDEQVLSTIKLLVALLADPYLTATTLGRSVGRTEAWVNRQLMRFRDAGLDVEYDRPKERYRVKLGPEMQRKLKAYALKSPKPTSFSSPRKNATASESSPNSSAEESPTSTT